MIWLTSSHKMLAKACAIPEFAPVTTAVGIFFFSVTASGFRDGDGTSLVFDPSMWLEGMTLIRWSQAEGDEPETHLVKALQAKTPSVSRPGL